MAELTPDISIKQSDMTVIWLYLPYLRTSPGDLAQVS